MEPEGNMTMSESRRVVLVGHCGPDARLIGAAVRRVAPNAVITSTDDEGTLNDSTSGDAILMINRVLDGDFADEGGIDLIKRLKQKPNPPLLMLISNHADAQEQAMAAGAIRGFGKSHLYNEETAAIIRDAVAVNSQSKR
jgi:CheY-like chemotaxis protein